MASEIEFNPFEDRLSRDLRNDLSEGFAKQLETGDSILLTELIDNYAKQLPAGSCYTTYLVERTDKYWKALETIARLNYSDPIQRALALWNQGLFFEMHEALEHLWYDAQNHTRAILQALIRAAGVYIKLEYNFNDSAERIAAKVTPVLRQHRDILAELFDVDTLIDCLELPLSPPPQLTIAASPVRRSIF